MTQHRCQVSAHRYCNILLFRRYAKYGGAAKIRLLFSAGGSLAGYLPPNHGALDFFLCCTQLELVLCGTALFLVFLSLGFLLGSPS